MQSRTTSLKGISLHVRSDLHLSRKAWHVATGLFGLWIYSTFSLSAQLTANILFGVAFAGLTIDFFRLRLPKLNALVVLCMKNFMRESEKTSYSGLPFYALGVALSLTLFPERLAVLAILFLIFSDPLSSVFGILFGREKILPNKSLQGSLAGFLTCYFITLAYSLHYLNTASHFDILVFAIFAGLLGCLSELVAGKIDDNLTIPVLSGAGLTLLNSLLPLF